jgi:hypothetical protein
MAATVQQLTSGALDSALCPQVKRDGDQCRNRAGHRTEHPGYGYCWKHGGNTAAHAAAGAKMMAVAVAREQFGAEDDIDPLEAMLYTVRRGRALASYWRQRAVALVEDEEKFERAAKMEAGALDDLNRWSHGAVKAGVAERLVRITERTAERLTAAAEDMLAALVASGLELSGEQRALAVRTYTASLYALEQGDVIEGEASDV